MMESSVKVNQKHIKSKDGVISILEDIQKKYGYLPENILKTVAEENGKSLVDIYGVATFYRSFSLKPKGKHLISVCLGTACHVRGGPIIAKELERQLKIQSGETTADKEFTLETVACLGACALGPIVVADGRYFSNVKPNKIKMILKKTRSGFDELEVKANDRIFPVRVSCKQCNHSLMDPTHLIDGYASIKVTFSFNQKHGWLRLSSLYGSYNTKSEYKIPKDTVINFFCPFCHAELTTFSNCTECSASMVPMIVSGGGIIQICSRSGCKGHMLNVDGVNI